jgi:hypothetical protein
VRLDATLLAAGLACACGRIDIDPVSVDAAPSCGTALFCDGFESGDVSRWTETEIDTDHGATLDVTDALAHSGRFSLDANVPPGPVDGMFSVVVEQVGQRSTGMLAVRLWVYSATSFGDFDGPLLVHDVSQAHQLLVSGNTSDDWDVSEQGGATDHPSVIPTAAGTWTCLELDYTFGSSPMIELDVDGAVVVTAVAADTSAVFDSVDVGVARSAAPGAEMFIDDVVISLAHVGCE